MGSNNSAVGKIIHGAAIAAGAAASGMAQIPGSDNLVITPIQAAMITAIGKYHDKDLDKSATLAILSGVSAGVAGRAISQWAVGWIPGWGNAINAATAVAITEAIGWAANDVLSGQDTMVLPSSNITLKRIGG